MCVFSAVYIMVKAACPDGPNGGDSELARRIVNEIARVLDKSRLAADAVKCGTWVRTLRFVFACC
jgi:hypothetical protein